MEYSHEYYMKKALNEANNAFEADEVPIGAVVVLKNRIVGRGHNMVETLTDATAHAEIIALTAAFQTLGSKYLPEATLYVTIEPCNMCSGALFWSKISRVVYGAADKKHGAISLNLRPPFHPKTEILSGILEEECSLLIKEFFKRKR